MFSEPMEILIFTLIHCLIYFLGFSKIDKKIFFIIVSFEKIDFNG